MELFPSWGPAAASAVDFATFDYFAILHDLGSSMGLYLGFKIWRKTIILQLNAKKNEEK